VKYGSYVYNEREILVNELIPVFQEYYSLISSGKESVKLKYRSHLSEGNFTGNSSELLKQRQVS
jgi:DNA replication and repair protein RecF